MNKKRALVIVVIVAAAALLSVLLYTMLGDHRPVIASLQAEPDGVLPWGTCRIVCNATDPDGDELSYNWSAAQGAIETTGEADTIIWTAPFSLGSYNVSVIVSDGRGGAAMGRVAVTVRTDRWPTISSLVVETDWTAPSGSIQVACNASDPDKDELSYEWTADGGHVSGSGAVVIWTAPQVVGVYNITVVVQDGYGGEATAVVSVSVDLGTPPTVEKLIVTPKGNIFLRKPPHSASDYDVWKLQEYDIECVASDTSSEVSYNWSCDDGEISGEGPAIIWTAPNEKSVQVTVRVTVSDAMGNSIRKDIVFWMAPCTCGSWGLKSGEISF